VYKKGQGFASRIGVVGLGLLVGLYAGHSWYYWPSIYPSAATTIAERVLSTAFIGAILLLLGTTAGGVYVALFQPMSSDYLIDMDTELRKVVWPAVMPLFDPKTEAWGSTYVVIACTVILTVFIWLIDLGMDFTITQHLLRWLG